MHHPVWYMCKIETVSDGLWNMYYRSWYNGMDINRNQKAEKTSFQCHFINNKSYLKWLGAKMGLGSEKPGSSCLNNGMASRWQCVEMHTGDFIQEVSTYIKLCSR
jgi:hypothetical protein